MSDRNLIIVELQADLSRIRDRLEFLKDAVAEPLPIVVAEPAPPQYGHAGFPSESAEGSFYQWLRDNDMLGPVISPTEFKGCDQITRACAAAKWGISWTAYALGTAYLETAAQMIPVREAYWLSEAKANAYFTRMYDIRGQRPAKARELGNIHPGDGAKYCGRGYPQLTGRTNYEEMAEATGADLINHPEMALVPEVAAKIMIVGMSKGTFTGKSLGDYLPKSGKATHEKFKPARRIINGTDRADDVAGFAVNFQAALEAGQWQF